jgi:hypothetical protein
LCGHCNIGLGNFRDDVGVLKAAITYIEEFQSRRMLKEKER